MADWSIDTWVGLAIFIGAIVTSVLAAFWQRKQESSDDDEKPFRPRPVTVELADEDRKRVDHLADNLARIPRAIEDHAEIVGKHRHAIGDHIAQLRRDDRRGS